VAKIGRIRKVLGAKISGPGKERDPGGLTRLKKEEAFEKSVGKSTKKNSKD